ncbi:uncharacterized protein [Solanum lycopersicum]|uniref:uncharacterized protein n=1 Tax=Solanum lycopersicum TaxID=4081 RepID=UPI00374878A2
MSKFSDMVEDTIELCMDDFSVVGNSFDRCLSHLVEVIKRCEYFNLVLNWEKCHFMVKEVIVLGHRILEKWIEVDRAKVEVIERLPPPIFVKASLKAFGELKEKFVSAPIIISPDWSKPFKVMCDASGDARSSYELHGNRTGASCSGVCIQKKFSYLLGTRLIVHTDHSALWYLMIVWGTENQVANHLSILEDEAMRELGEKAEIDDAFPDEHILASSHDLIPWFAGFANYLLYRSCTDGIIRRGTPEFEMLSVLEACHSSPVGGHYSGIRTTHKILRCGYYWPTIHQDAHEIAKTCDWCQRDGGILKRQGLPLNPIWVIELFDVWDIDFMGPFVSFHGMEYILVEVDYVSKWVEAIALPNNEGNSVTAFLKKNTFSRFGTPRPLLVMVALSFVMNCSKGCLRNMGFAIMWLILIIHRLADK